MPFETDHLLIPPGQGAAGDEDAADVLDDLAFGEFVQGFVSEETAPGAEVGQDGGDDAAREPAQRGGGSFGAGQGLMEGLKLRGYGARVVGEEFVEPLLERAARARTGGSQSFRCPAGGTRAPELGSGAVQGPQMGASVVPEWMPRSLPREVQ
ncbi:hypothetical protein ACFQ7W_30730 [Streptomyces niveus]|uniref:hypothetical protein n=1 Tax=Streptomyces niveus TaxID=193462 RepID=UPI0036B8E658